MPKLLACLKGGGGFDEQQLVMRVGLCGGGIARSWREAVRFEMRHYDSSHDCIIMQLQFMGAAMARRAKLEVCAVNIRIPSDKERNYNALLEGLLQLKRGVRTFGDSYLAITAYDQETGRGVLSKYSEIDLDGDWFDTEDFTAAEPEQTDDIKIPANLKPNLSNFFFQVSRATASFGF